MKIAVLVLSLLVMSFVAEAQPPNYLYRTTRERLIAGMYDSTLHIPAGNLPSLRTGGSPRAGAVWIDTTGAVKGVYYYIGGAWQKVVDTASLTSMLSALTFQNVLSNGSILTQNNTIDGGGFVLRFTNLDDGSGLEYDDGSVLSYIRFSPDPELRSVATASTGFVSVNSTASALSVLDNTSTGYSSSITALRDSIKLEPHQGKIHIDTLARTTDSTGYDFIVWGRNNKGVRAISSSLMGSGGGGADSLFGKTDTVFTENRHVNGQGLYSFLVDSIADFQINDGNGNNRFQLSNVRTKLFSASGNTSIEMGDTLSLTAPQFHITDLPEASNMTDKSVMVWDSVTTHWQRIVKDSIGGSSGGPDSLFGKKDSVLSASRYVNLNTKTFDFKAGTVGVGAVDSVGPRLTYPWSTNPLSADWSASGTTPTTDGVTTVINGTTTLSSAKKTGVENFTIRFTAISNTKSSVVQSISALIKSDTVSAATTRKITWLLADTAGYINTFRNDGATTPLASNRGYQQLLWAASDTFDFEFINRSRYILANMTNRANGQRSYFRLDVNAGIGNVGIIQLIVSGNFTLLNNFVYTVDEIFRPDFVIDGDSETAGSGTTSVHTRWVNKVFEKYSNTWVVHAGGSERQISTITRFDEIGNAIYPRYVIDCYGVNDLNGGYIGLFAQYKRRYYDSLNAHGIGIIAVSLVPQAANVATFNDTIQAIATDKGALYVNVTTTLQAGSANFNKNTLYMPPADLVHMNDIGNQIFADVMEDALLQAGLLKRNPSFVVDNIPATNKFAYIMATDENNSLVKIPSGIDTSYIKNILYTAGVANAQTANINIDGTGNIGGRFQANGNGTDPNPNFLVDAGTVTVSNFSASSAHFTISGAQTAVNSNWLQFPNGTAFIRTTGNGSMRIKTGISGAGSGSLGVCVSTEGSVPSLNFKPLLVQIADSNKAVFDRHGGLVLNWNGEAATKFQVKGDNDTAALYVNAATDFTGLGLIAPEEKLHVVGQIKISSIAGAAFASMDSVVVMEDGRLKAVATPADTWTPTASAASGGTVGTVGVFTYARQGNIVTISGKVSITHTIGSSLMTFELSLPSGHTSNFASDENANGTAGTIVTGSDGIFEAEPTNDTIKVSVYGGPTAGAGMGIRITGQYRVL